MALEREIFAHLRANKKSLAEDIAFAIGKDIAEVHSALASLEKRGGIRMEGKHAVSLMPVTKVRKSDKVTPQFDPSQHKKHLMGIGLNAAPQVNVSLMAPRDQGSIGDCVGQAFSQYAEAVAQVLAGDVPTSGQMAQYQAGVTDENGALVDILYPMSKSAACIYIESRVVANINSDPEDGSFDWAAAQAWIQNGQCFESQWPSAKGGSTFYSTAPNPALVAVEIPKHVATSYSQVSGGAVQAQLQAALDTCGFCAVGILVFDNYTDMLGGNGDWLMPEKGATVAGGHELFCYGYDSTGLLILNSWGTVCGRQGHLPWAYCSYDDPSDGYAMQALTIVQVSKDVSLANESATMTLTVDVPATIATVPVNFSAVSIGTAPVTTTLEMNVPINFVVTPTTSSGATTNLTETFTGGGSFEFQIGGNPSPNPPNPQPGSLWERFVAWLESLFSWL